MTFYKNDSGLLLASTLCNKRNKNRLLKSVLNTASATSNEIKIGRGGYTKMLLRRGAAASRTTTSVKIQKHQRVVVVRTSPISKIKEHEPVIIIKTSKQQKKREEDARKSKDIDLITFQKSLKKKVIIRRRYNARKKETQLLLP
jgi:hypothetical protein